ncbi:MAG: hypothetical protein LQ338_004764 [Usnochroma carphineum]|nr:MAG: hypothetical protein LQ338_004764 [Usnochroma carphineum]
MESAAHKSGPANDDEQGKARGTKGNDGSASGTSTPHHSSATPRLMKRASTTSLVPSTSSTNSPKASRETSPVRPPLRSGVSANSGNPRSRKNSTDLSPNRGPALPGPFVPAVPSAAAIQRALSVAGAHQLQPSTHADQNTDPVRPQKVIKTALANSNQSSPKLPTVTSPPPPAANKGAVQPAKRSDQASTASSTPGVVDRPNRLKKSSADTDVPSSDGPAPTGIRIPSRAVSGSQPALETVQEASLPNTPTPETGAAQQGMARVTSVQRPERIDEDPAEDDSGKDVNPRPESGNESGESKKAPSQDSQDAKQQDTAKPSAVRPQVVHSKKSTTQLHPAKGKTGAEGTVKSMTVETETVSSIPQVAIGGGTGERGLLKRTDTAGSLRLKPSTETIRPKKEKKRVVRKAPSLNAGTASSKSDIFEAKVASAVDEANSSDSEETFVYESNPPEPLSARPHRFHSRTPSATSMASQIDQYGIRARQDGHHSIAGKKSMKFANNSYHSANFANEAGETGTVRGPNQSNRGAPSHHRHIGHYGRNGGHTSLFDNESPFPNATKPLRSPASNAARLSARSSSPRSPHMLKVSGNPQKMGDTLIYDLECEGADDERTPLIGSVRSGRTRINRRVGTGSSRNGYLPENEKRRRTCRTVTVCTSLITLLAALIAAVIVIMVMCSKPLKDVHIKDIRNVLASEQEIMLDLHVHAVNPNLVAIQVSDLDINIFAKSKHVGTNEMWRHRGSRHPPNLHQPSNLGDPYYPPFTSGGVDKGTDPITDPETDSQTMLLGRIFEFDSPLIFDPSPLHHTSLSSIGEVRLAHPGNRTEEGGSERWEKVLGYDFELIVRGVVKYGLPLSSVRRKASVGASVVVKVADALDPGKGARPRPGSDTHLQKPERVRFGG